MGPRFNDRGKIRHLCDEVWLRFVASMGPRFNDRGKSQTVGVVRQFCPGFNGAAVQ